jgi:hypothetical protein
LAPNRDRCSLRAQRQQHRRAHRTLATLPISDQPPRCVDEARAQTGYDRKKRSAERCGAPQITRMLFKITGLSPDAFRPLYGLSDDQLSRRGVRRYIADRRPAFPDRIEMRDAEPGEALLLVNYVHQPANTPYHASHAIFVREGAERTFEAIDEVPEVLRIRKISLRGFQADHYLADAALVDGRELEREIERLLAVPEVAYIQAHYAVRGCYAARIERA